MCSLNIRIVLPSTNNHLWSANRNSAALIIDPTLVHSQIFYSLVVISLSFYNYTPNRSLLYKSAMKSASVWIILHLFTVWVSNSMCNLFLILFEFHTLSRLCNSRHCWHSDFEACRSPSIIGVDRQTRWRSEITHR